MIRYYRFSSRAERDLLTIRAWYDKRGVELTNRFLDELDAAIAGAMERPASFPLVRRGVRQMRLKRFPYRVFFKADESRIDILAIYHTSRNPRRWADPDRE